MRMASTLASTKEKGNIREMEDRKLLGKIGEDMAESMLFSEGYTILERNFRSYYGEADIICKKDGVLFFVEVKTRTSEKFGEPYEAVDEVRQFRMKKTAEYYLYRKYDGDEPVVAFKVIEILVRETDDDFIM